MTFSSNSTLGNLEEKTEVTRGMENIIEATLTRFSLTKHTIDSCIDKDNPKTIVTHNRIVSAIIHAKNRGIRTRVITEITIENLSYCKELINLTSEVRHLEDVIGNFSISDKSIYQAAAMGDFSRPMLNRSQVEKTEPTPVSETINSTMSAFVAQQQYFFEMLWKKAIPAAQRIREIEENLKREFIETIRDTEETTSLISKVLSSATEEILIVFSRAGTLKKYEKLGMLDIVRKKADKEIEVRILIGTDRPTNERDVEWLREYPRIELRYLNKSIQTRLTTIVTDRELSLVIEERKDEDDLGFATYSNSESTVLSCASIFENLWAQSTRPTQNNG
jgi:two-component system, OmpR family, sensor histidine kinase VicK